MRHAFLSVGGGLAAGLAAGEKIVRGWIDAVEADVRTEEPLAGLRIALQCGGSDAFSGVSGNPLAGAIVHELIRHGGTGVLCETDETAGAEAYVLRNTRDIEMARGVLRHIQGFKERLSWHGVTPESNPSGGNKLRGLYNITLKSLGAVHKKDPRTPVDHVIDYADPLTAPGFYFMNSPGNDLEGIAGQVASGCNLMLFVTGNGSITNFPFVPTLKITTTTQRHLLLKHEMDINAGRYLDGEAMPALVDEAFDLTIATASGERTQGEKAGHSQAQLWRNWRQTSAARIEAIEARPVPDGQPLPVAATGASAGSAPARIATERIGLVLPTSMCSSQIARLAAARLNDSSVGLRHGIDRFVALAHSEGCGFGGGSTYDTLQRTFRGYATHPNVAAALLLEHGCEKVPNDAMRRDFERAELPLDRFGWASVQLDGGIDRVIGRVQQWFATRPAFPPAGRDVRLGALTIGVLSAVPPEAAVASSLAALVNAALADGGTVLIPEGDPLIADAGFRRAVLGDTPPRATLVYGEPVATAGFHLVQTDTDHWVENVTGLAACGAHLVVGAVGDGPQQGHPLVAVVQVAGAGARGVLAEEDVDFVASGAEDRPRAAGRAGAGDGAARRGAGGAGGRLRRVPAHPRLLGVSTSQPPALRPLGPSRAAGAPGSWSGGRDRRRRGRRRRSAGAGRPRWSATACRPRSDRARRRRAGRPGPTPAADPGRPRRGRRCRRSAARRPGRGGAARSAASSRPARSRSSCQSPAGPRPKAGGSSSSASYWRPRRRSRSTKRRASSWIQRIVDTPFRAAFSRAQPIAGREASTCVTRAPAAARATDAPPV